VYYNTPSSLAIMGKSGDAAPTDGVIIGSYESDSGNRSHLANDGVVNIDDHMDERSEGATTDPGFVRHDIDRGSPYCRSGGPDALDVNSGRKSREDGSKAPLGIVTPDERGNVGQRTKPRISPCLSSSSTDPMPPALLQTILSVRMNAEDIGSKELSKGDLDKNEFRVCRSATSGGGLHYETLTTGTSSFAHTSSGSLTVDKEPGAFARISDTSPCLSSSFTYPPDLLRTVLSVDRAPGAVAVYPGVPVESELFDSTSSVMLDEESATMSHRTTFVTAFHVSQTIVDEEVRQRIMREAVEAEVVAQVENKHQGARFVGVLCLLLVLVIAVTVPVTFVVVANVSNNSDEEQEGNLTAIDKSRPTLTVIKERGVIRCGVTTDTPGFASLNVVTGKIEGISVDYVSAPATSEAPEED
jgi:hypothetical protein